MPDSKDENKEIDSAVVKINTEKSLEYPDTHITMVDKNVVNKERLEQITTIDGKFVGSMITTHREETDKTVKVDLNLSYDNIHYIHTLGAEVDGKSLLKDGARDTFLVDKNEGKAKIRESIEMIVSAGADTQWEVNGQPANVRDAKVAVGLLDAKEEAQYLVNAAAQRNVAYYAINDRDGVYGDLAEQMRQQKPQDYIKNTTDGPAAYEYAVAAELYLLGTQAAQFVSREEAIEVMKSQYGLKSVDFSDPSKRPPIESLERDADHAFETAAIRDANPRYKVSYEKQIGPESYDADREGRIAEARYNVAKGVNEALTPENQLYFNIHNAHHPYSNIKGEKEVLFTDAANKETENYPNLGSVPEDINKIKGNAEKNFVFADASLSMNESYQTLFGGNEAKTMENLVGKDINGFVVTKENFAVLMHEHGTKGALDILTEHKQNGTQTEALEKANSIAGKAELPEERSMSAGEKTVNIQLTPGMEKGNGQVISF